MEEAYEKLKKEGKNNVEHLVEWMKHAKLFSSKAKEEAAKKHFEGCDHNNVDYEKFQEVVKKVADEHKSTLESLNEKLVAHGTKFIDSLKAGASAMSEKLHHKK